MTWNQFLQQLILTKTSTIVKGVLVILMWIDQYLGGIIASKTLTVGVKRFLGSSFSKAVRMAYILQWAAVASVIMLVAGYQFNWPAMMYVACVFWAFMALVIMHGIDPIAQRYPSTVWAFRFVGMFCLFVFWSAFMCLTGAPALVGWQKSFEILTFLMFMNAAGVLTGSKTPWARWLMTWSIVFVLVTSVIPFERIPILASFKHAIVALVNRSAVETQKAARVVEPDKLEQLVPDKFYTTARSARVFICNHCKTSTGYKVDSTTVVDPRVVDPTRTNTLPIGKWVAQVPGTDVYTFRQRSFLLVYAAFENDADNGFDERFIYLVSPDVLEAREVNQPTKQTETSALVSKFPKWGWWVGGVVLVVCFVLAVVGFIRSNTAKYNNPTTALTTAANAPASSAAHPAGHTEGDSPWPWLGPIIAVLLTIIIGTFCVLKMQTNTAEMVRNMPAVPLGTTVPVSTPVVPVSAPSTSAAPSGEVVNDPRYPEVGNMKFFHLETSDIQHIIRIDARLVSTILPTPHEGDVWEFSFTDDLVCSWGVRCTDSQGQTDHRKPGMLTDPAEIKKYNVTDFPCQNCFQQEAFVRIGENVTLPIGNGQSWTVPNGLDGKLVAVGFNIRTSEAYKAKGGGILKIKITKKEESGGQQ